MITIDTPIGPVNAPSFIAAKIEPLTDRELLQSLYTPNNEFIDPFVYGEIQKRIKRRQWTIRVNLSYKSIAEFLARESEGK